MRDHAPIDDPDDEILPVSPPRRRWTLAVGCLMVVAILAALVWFAVTHLDTLDS